MSALDSYSVIERLGPVVTTAEVAAALRRDVSSASRFMGGLEKSGHVHRLRAGLWSVGSDEPDPFAVAPELTRPHPAYVSFQSAMGFHGMIDQIPRQITIASLDRARRIKTGVGTFSVHHLPPELFSGWTETPRGRVATPAKAIFDLCYVSAVRTGRPRRVPEIELPNSFDAKSLEPWIRRIESPRVATLTRKAVDYTLSRATR